ncbi:MAG: hypothetical protein ACRC7W_05640 [Fusobacteriaceae bacterium]
MKKQILLSLFLITQLVVVGNDSIKEPQVLAPANAIIATPAPAAAPIVAQVKTADPVNEIVDNREIFQEQDLEEIKVPEFKIEDISRKIISLEAENVIYKDKIEKLEIELKEKSLVVEDLNNKVEKLILITNSLDEMGKTFLPKTVNEINKKLYRTGMIIISVLAGITLILISLVVLQTNKNKKMVEEWKEFFDMNLDVLKRENNYANKEDEFVNKMKDKKTSDMEDEIFL